MTRTCECRPESGQDRLSRGVKAVRLVKRIVAAVAILAAGVGGAMAVEVFDDDDCDDMMQQVEYDD